MKVRALTGNGAVVKALEAAKLGVYPSYPISPNTRISEDYEKLVADGVVDTEMRLMDSELSAISAAHGASIAGSRVFTATSSQGLALMHKGLYVAAGTRAPIVMAVANRALSAPINIHADHSDMMGCRDAGWIQLYAEGAQELYDTILQAFRIAEHPDVLLPVMVGYDGFTVSHSVARVELLEDEEAGKFVGTYKPLRSLLDIKRPATYGAFALPEYYMPYKRQQRQAMEIAHWIIGEVAHEYEQVSDRYYGLLDTYLMEHADVAIVIIGSSALTAKNAAKQVAEEEGIQTGVVRVRSYRPFPTAEVRDLLRHTKAVAVLDRADSPGTLSGPLYADVSAALNGLKGPVLIPHVYGLGGRELSARRTQQLFRNLEHADKNGITGERELFLEL